MNWSTIENGWRDYKFSAKQQWNKLSDEQLDGTMGKREQLATRVQEAYALSADDAERQIADWQEKQHDIQASAAKS